jgi:hypothetical protein
LQVLNGLRAHAPTRATAWHLATALASARNLAINETTGCAYAVGTNRCGLGLHIIDIRIPSTPTCLQER